MDSRLINQKFCLYLNIYTPTLPEEEDGVIVSQNYSVLVYIHGGGHTSGNGSRYGADYFMDENCIIVTLEFRLGVFGFLSTEDMEVQGNNGFKDVIMSLRWIKENIGMFGGDPSRVLVFGSGSGGMTVHSLLISHMSTGLFQKAIIQSGVSIVQGSVVPNPRTIAVNLGIEVGCAHPNSTEELINCLRTIDAKDLAIVENPYIFFGPSVEVIPPDGNLSNTFFSQRPFELMYRDDYAMKVPLILGDNSAEELSNALCSLKDLELIRELNNNWVDTIKTKIKFLHTPSERKLKKIKRFYFGNWTIGNHTRYQLVNLLSDALYVHGTKLAALAHARHSPVYLYWLTKEPAISHSEVYKEGFSPPFGVAQADELQYLFLYDGYPEIPIGTTYTRFSQKLIRNWVNYADYSKPSLLEWEPVNVADNGSEWFHLSDDVRMSRLALRERMKFWDFYIHELYE